MSRQLTLAAALSLMVGVTVLGARETAPTAGPAPAPTEVADGGSQAPRDVGPQVNVRRIPIGTATLSGTVVDAATGRPLALARVSISGQTGAVGARPTTGPGSGTGTGGGTGRGRGLAPSAAGPDGLITTLSVGFFSRHGVTDSRGQFSFRSLPAGQFVVTVMRDQFLTQNYGQSMPNRPGTPVRVTEGGTVSITVRMQKGGVIVGSVMGEDGQPAAGARVQAMRFGYAQGVRRLMTTTSVASDDRGAYRLFGLQPGEYIVAATPSMSAIAMIETAAIESAAFEAALAAALASSPGELPAAVAVAAPGFNSSENPTAGYAPTYFPSTATASSAERVLVEAGKERVGVDVMVLPIRAGNVAGQVIGLSSPEVLALVSLRSDDPAGITQTMTTQTAADGTFILRNVMPGRYDVFAQTVTNNRQGPPTAMPGAVFGPPTQLAPADRLWGRAEVVVEGQTTPRVTIVLEPPKTISGIVVVEPDANIPLAQMRLNVSISPAPATATVPMPGAQPSATVDADARFTLEGVVPGHYQFRVNGPVRSAVWNGRDLLDFPLVVEGEDIANLVVTLGRPGTASLSGTLNDPQGLEPTIYTVVIVSSDTQYWVPGGRRIRTSRPGADGLFRFAGLPAGSYRMAAVTDLEPGGEYDPEFLAAMTSASIAVTLVEGASATQDIRVSR